MTSEMIMAEVKLVIFKRPTVRYRALMLQMLFMSYKRIALFFVLCAAPLICDAQQGRITLKEALDSISLDVPTDKIFLHTDRNLYHPGDTIYFQSYIEDRFTQKFETESLSSWVLLLDSDGGTIDSARFRIDYSLSPGWMTIPTDCMPGWYCLRAFTSIMQNYDGRYAFSQWIRIDDLIKDRVSFYYEFDRKQYGSKDTVTVSLSLSDQNGEPLNSVSYSYSTLLDNNIIETYRSKTNRDGKSLFRIYLPDSLERKELSIDISLEKGLGESRIDIPRQSENPDIRFLPEGGNFVSGYLQRLAFNAVSQSGEQLYLHGVIRDDLGNFIDSAIAGHLGIGVVQITPARNRKYHAEFIEYPGRQWPLPEISDDFPAIRLTQSDNSVLVDVTGGNPGALYHLALTMNYNLLAFYLFEPEGLKRINVNIDSLPAGTATITLFDELLRPLAERSFFARGKNRPEFAIGTEFEYYFPGQECEISVEIGDNAERKMGALFSIAIIDSATAVSPLLNQKTIRDEFLFEHDFYQRVPNHIKRMGLSTLSEDDIDLLFLTYGWTRFNWNIPVARTNDTLVNYDLYNIGITNVLSATKRKKIVESDNPLFVLSIEEPALLTLSQSDSSSFILDIGSIPPETSSIMLVPNFTVKRKAKGAVLKPRINVSYIDSLHNENEALVLDYKGNSGIYKEPEMDLGSTHIINEVSVYAKRTPAKKFVNEYEKRYQSATTRTISNLAVESAMTLEDLLRRLNPSSLNTQTLQIYFRPISSVSGPPPPALFVLDGVPQGTTYGSLTGINPSNIHSVSALLGVTGFYIYGEDARGGVVFVETLLNNYGTEYEVSRETVTFAGDLRKIIQLFRPLAEFYNPPKEVMESDPQYWIRPTLYWNHEVFYDGINPVILNFYNHQMKGTVNVIVNGVTIDGEPISGMYKYNIR